MLGELLSYLIGDWVQLIYYVLILQAISTIQGHKFDQLYQLIQANGHSYFS